jgi:hypothetical protein
MEVIIGSLELCQRAWSNLLRIWLRSNTASVSVKGRCSGSAYTNKQGGRDRENADFVSKEELERLLKIEALTARQAALIFAENEKHLGDP